MRREEGGEEWADGKCDLGGRRRGHGGKETGIVKRRGSERERERGQENGIEGFRKGREGREIRK